jgi:hypothetical protein
MSTAFLKGVGGRVCALTLNWEPCIIETLTKCTSLPFERIEFVWSVHQKRKMIGRGTTRNLFANAYEFAGE